MHHYHEQGNAFKNRLRDWRFSKRHDQVSSVIGDSERVLFAKHRAGK
jgi:hypothetical protein